MNPLQELRLHVEALAVAIETNPKFFASIVHYVRRLRQILTEATDDLSQSELQVLATKIEGFYVEWRPTGQGLYIPPRETSDTDSTVVEINRLVSRLALLDESAFRELTRQITTAATGKPPPPPEAVAKTCVFVGHGRSKLWARVKVFLEDELGLATITYESEPRTGESIVPILEKMLTQATFAVLILTAEDETSEGHRRARQNVIHEAGLFQGKLGFKKAILLVQHGVESFTNVAGLQHIPFSGESIEQTFYELQRALRRERQLQNKTH